MGLKLVNLSTMVSPWQCFTILSKLHHHHHRHRQSPVIKLVRWDGHVMIYEKRQHASQLMLEFPKHLVCRSDSFFIGQKIPPLEHHDHLELGHTYFLLPTHVFHSVLSFVTISSLASSTSTSQLTQSSPGATFLKKAAAVTCQPFDIIKTSAGCLRIRVCEEFLSQLLLQQAKIREEEEKDELISTGGYRLCTTSKLHKDYMQLVGARKCWEPKLNTIRESSHDKRKMVSFGMIKRSSRKYCKPRLWSQMKRRYEIGSPLPNQSIRMIS